ncbi:MAG: hypothetical protein CMO80_07975 [Verrucomicrobiales bacterium]|nr:hypothetical protein [Verrucomicrobiales bacterium]|tara:strand:+ start:3103 stop:3441 length:339 start_codon:yes stop_codon:yes gene_type:complete
MTDRTTDILVNGFLSVACFVLGVVIWSEIFGLILGALGRPGGSYAWWFVISVNIAHFFFGMFHANDDIGTGAPHEHVVGRLDLKVIIHAISIITIGGSSYARVALEACRSGK